MARGGGVFLFTIVPYAAASRRRLCSVRVPAVPRARGGRHAGWPPPYGFPAFAGAMVSVVRRTVLPFLLALSCAALARAQGPVLHEYVPDPGAEESTLLVSGHGDQATAIVYDGQVLPAPEGGALRSDERAISAAPDPSAPDPSGGGTPPPAPASYRPDRVTSLDGAVSFYAVFTPTVAPFKRMTALDQVAVDADGTPFLRIASTATRRVPVVGVSARPPDRRARDRFWGSVVIDFARGRRAPLPSVSPESRILSLRTEPPSPVHVEKDGADNYFLVADGPLPASQVRAVYLMDAPQGYFNMPIPDAPSDELADEVPPMPDSVRARALRFAGELGLSRGQGLRLVLDTLVAYFRSFEESEQPPRDTGDIYLDLARGKRGVCRHRAYAFVITAQALGIPARFVDNEAHAWVEVRLPTVGFLRIDLGGSAKGLEAHNADDRPVYRPHGADPLPEPPAYLAALAKLRKHLSGLQTPHARERTCEQPRRAGIGERAGRGGGPRPWAGQRGRAAVGRHVERRRVRRHRRAGPRAPRRAPRRVAPRRVPGAVPRGERAYRRQHGRGGHGVARRDRPRRRPRDPARRDGHAGQRLVPRELRRPA